MGRPVRITFGRPSGGRPVRVVLAAEVAKYIADMRAAGGK